MPLKDYLNAKKIIQTNDSGDFEGQKDQNLIQTAENALGLVFPPTYKSFLLDFGCGEINGHEIYGIISDKFENSSVPNGIWLTLDERKTSKLPSNLIIISQGYDGYLAIDVSQKNTENENPIIEWIPGNPNNSLTPIFNDFGVYFLDCVEM